MSKIGFLFEVSSDDLETVSMLHQYRQRNHKSPFFEIKVRDDLVHHEHEENSRMWTLSKYENMVSMRNSLLERVREISPDYYYSLDSDVLITNPSTINSLISHVQSGADAVNSLMFMTPMGIMYPSVMDWIEDSPEKGYRKTSYPYGSYFKSDIIMAAKMMSRSTYEDVDYQVHPQGEDLGWCLNAKEKKKNLYCASYIYTPHIMNQGMLATFLESGDERAKVAQGVHV